MPLLSGTVDGKAKHPGWNQNPCARPEVTIKLDEESLSATERKSSDEERHRIWQ